MDCVSGEGGPGCDRMDRCVTVTVWQKLKEAVEGVVDAITLRDLANDYYRKNPPDYCI